MLRKNNQRNKKNQSLINDNTGDWHTNFYEFLLALRTLQQSQKAMNKILGSFRFDTVMPSLNDELLPAQSVSEYWDDSETH